MEEAANELAFISTGLYGKPLPPQNGGPIRLTVPWKYGFKSAKVAREGELRREAPDHVLGGDRRLREYGFWANVNPAVPHPRWSQATEKLLARRSGCRHKYSMAMARSSLRCMTDGRAKSCSCDCARILAVFAAICLVGAVALATLRPPDVPLGQALYSHRS